MELYYAAWQKTTTDLFDIPVNKAQLLARSGGFDKGKTSAWMSGLKRPTWRAVHNTLGHSIHCVSDRPFEALTADLRLGLRILSWMSCKTPTTWYWWDHPWPRVLPAAVDPLMEHVNGGWATPGIPEVHVYRREEAHKVLLHEAIHALSLDVRETDAVREELEASMGRQFWPHIGEAYTEFFAEWLWAIASATKLTSAEQNWRAQRACSEKQAAIIWARIRDAVSEDTNVFAYYILKWVLMKHSVEVLMGPQQTVAKWVHWWRLARPELEEMAMEAAHTEHTAHNIGMTCSTG